jgi:hypothetical protein
LLLCANVVRKMDVTIDLPFLLENSVGELRCGRQIPMTNAVSI